MLAQPTINKLVSGRGGGGGERYVCNVRAELSNLGGKYTPGSATHQARVARTSFWFVWTKVAVSKEFSVLQTENL